MQSTRKILTSLLTAGIVSSAAIGTAMADFPRQTFGDLSGNEPVSVRQLQAANAKALQAGRGHTVRANSAAATADFADQAYGDLNGDVPVPVRGQARSRVSADLLILPSLGDWNGTSAAGPINKEGRARQ